MSKPRSPAKPKVAKKKVKRRTGIERPRNGGDWTEARFITFVKNCLRGGRWPQKYVCIQKAFVEHGINPLTGMKCKLCRCEHCKKLFPQGKLRADHITSVVGPEGFVDWNTFVARLFVEGDGYQALCEGCHDLMSEEERVSRAVTKAQSTEEPFKLTQ